MRATTESSKGPTVDFLSPPAAPAYYGPDSIHWQVFKNPVALGIGGICAVLLEFADPRIRSGVWDHSTFRIDPIGRSERTGLVAMASVYAPRQTAEKIITGVTRMHHRVVGETPAGQPYHAMDPELLNWVAATARYGFLKAYVSFVRPLTAAEQLRFWQEGEGLGPLWGVTQAPKSEKEFLQMMHALAPGFEPHPINQEFLEIVKTTTSVEEVPAFVRRAVTRAAVALLPPLVRERLALGKEYDLRLADKLALKLIGALVERRFDPASPPAQASERLGLPANFLWRSARERQRLLQALTEQAAVLDGKPIPATGIQHSRNLR